jgi:hypothetical protein
MRCECAVRKENRSSGIRMTLVGCLLKKEFSGNPLPSMHYVTKLLYGHLSTRWILLRARPRDLLRMARGILSFILRHQPPQDGKK